MEVYEPREDSYLLQKYVQKYSKGLVLDIGTGSGIQAITASKKADKVIATDINKKALEFAKLSSEIEKVNNIRFIKSDLFSKVPKNKFDLIVFNPPYLPTEKNIEDPALFSAKRGTETTIKFLDKVTDYLKKDGKILLISSSLANQNKILESFRVNLLVASIIDQKHVFFEDIILYLIKKSDLFNKLPDVKNAKLFNRGKRGLIIKAKYKKQDIAIKIKKPSSTAFGTIRIEAKFLQILNKHEIGPKLIKHTESYLMYMFVEGIFIEEFIEKNTKKDILIVLKKIFDQMHTLDKLGINKFEMHRPLKHIIIKHNNPVLIDFERCRYTEDPKNVTQFCDFLIGEDVIKKLKNKKIIINKEKVIELARTYKKNKDKYKLLINYFH